jgi:crotonobetainyl-CoA:carnitine CoA-transferase CaiB-like acyl-CoA transferase
MASRLMRIVGADDDAMPLPGSSVGDRRRAFVERWCVGRTVEDICATLGAPGVPAGPVRTIPEVAKDPHLWEREMLVKVDDAVAGEMYVPGVTIKLSRTPGRLGPVPMPGQHTDEVLGAVLGYDAATIEALRRDGAVK